MAPSAQARTLGSEGDGGQRHTAHLATSDWVGARWECVEDRDTCQDSLGPPALGPARSWEVSSTTTHSDPTLTLPLCPQSGVGTGTPGLLQLWQEQGCSGCHRACCFLCRPGRGVSPLRPRRRGQPQPLWQGPAAWQLLQQVWRPTPTAGPPTPPPASVPSLHLLPPFLQVVRQVLHCHRLQERSAGPQHRTRMGRCPYHRTPLGGNGPERGPAGQAGCGARGWLLSLTFSLQFVLGTDTFHLGYTETGHCLGKPNPMLAAPQRLQWDIPEQVCRPRGDRDGHARVASTWDALRGKGQELLRVQTGHRENRDPGTIGWLVKDVRWETHPWSTRSCLPLPTKPSVASGC